MFVSKISSDSNLLVPKFVDDFSSRLIVHHAVHDDKLTKKSFEFAFKSACVASGWNAVITGDPTNPGSDIVVNGVQFSLKTEAARSIKKRYITISKLMEARWIRNCQSKQDIAHEASTNISAHLEQYERIIMLRSFDFEPNFVNYDLIEIPKRILFANISKLKMHDFSDITRNGSSRADIFLDGKRVFSLRLDGSVEKITISNLDVDFCNHHGSWKIPIIRHKNC